jgi:hypothetical protein
LTLSVASVRLWDLWVWSRSISPLSLYSGHIGGPLFQFCSGVVVASHVRWYRRNFKVKKVEVYSTVLFPRLCLSPVVCVHLRLEALSLL